MNLPEDRPFTIFVFFASEAADAGLVRGAAAVQDNALRLRPAGWVYGLGVGRETVHWCGV